MTEPKPAAPQDGEREAFEAWQLDYSGSDAANERDEWGQYVSRLAMAHWAGWQARAALAQPVTHDDLPRCPRCDSNKTVFHCEQCGENF